MARADVPRRRKRSSGAAWLKRLHGAWCRSQENLRLTDERQAAQEAAAAATAQASECGQRAARAERAARATRQPLRAPTTRAPHAQSTADRAALLVAHAALEARTAELAGLRKTAVDTSEASRQALEAKLAAAEAAAADAQREASLVSVWARCGSGGGR